MTAAKQVGTSHLRRGEGCADAFAIASGDDVLVLAVADGAGSARCGAEGAAHTASRAVELALRETDLRSVFQATLDSLLERIGEQPPADFHTTLLLAILKDDTLAVGNIGDGWAVVREGGALRAVAAPERSEYVNETFFLTSRGALDEAVYEIVPAAGLDALALLTDGSAWFSIDLDNRTPSEALFGKLFAFASEASRPSEERDEELARFLASEMVLRKTDDDKTLILAVRDAR
ncbi:MAG TPA: PP2C family serine/threonine-protein phosphatase [Thermoanaerobaculia bacterium]|nr:PP2C family serine/threonine-protein phosphatase [Thermoanaerobaculia bacterium]